MSNRKIGNSFEMEFCELLFQRGFWCHNMAQNAAGQPADVIAVKNKTAYLIDCKVCSHNRFPLSRVEENQHFAMKTWKSCGNGEGWFALKVEDEIIMISHFLMVALMREKSVLNLTDIREHGTPLERWLKKCMPD
jgi:archaeal holliday junction resolvase (hjc)